MDLSKIALKPWYALVLLALLLALYAGALYPWLMHWGATDAELAMRLPGDEVVPQVSYVSNRAITIHAPAEEVWQWLAQVGQGKAGFYSNDWLENIFLADIHNGYQVHPEWQELKPGDLVRGTSENYLGGVLGSGLGWRLPIVEPGRAIYLWGPTVLIPIDAGTTRLIMRSPNGPMGPGMQAALALTMDPIHFVMERGMMLGLRDRAEGRSWPPASLSLAAALGWAIAGLGTAGLLFLRSRNWWWGIFPAAAFVAVIAITGDLRAATAGFVALGITIGGFVAYGRRWWPWLLVVASAVLLVLLLVETSWLFFGLAFLLGGVALAARFAARRYGSTTSRMAGAV